MFESRLAGVALGVAALAQPSAAQAQTCIAQADLADGIVYAMPSITEAIQRRCAATLADDGYLATSGSALAGKFAALQDEAWPGALRLLGQFAGSEDPSMSALFASLPEESLRPFVDAILTEKIGAEIKTKDCDRIERAMELLAPLPPENTAELVAFLASLAKTKGPAICPADRQ